jgi:hypothetical protein
MVGVHVVLPAGCPHTTQVNTKLVLLPSIGSFVTRPLTNCWAITATGTGAGFLYLTQSATPACPRDLFAGLLVQIPVDIAPGATPGDHDLALMNTTVGDNAAVTNGGCRGSGAIAGHLSVLP